MANNRLTRFRVPLGFLFAGWYLWLVWHRAPTFLAVSTVVVALGCALRSWAAGYLLKGKRVAVGGPYAFVRNPLYLGSFVIGCGFCLALFQLPVPADVLLFSLFFLGGFVVLYIAKGRSEEDELTRALGPDYERYRSRVPVFFPIRGRVSGLGEQHFSSELYRRNREYQCIWGCLAVLAFLYWRASQGA